MLLGHRWQLLDWELTPGRATAQLTPSLHTGTHHLLGSDVGSLHHDGLLVAVGGHWAGHTFPSIVGNFLALFL